MFTQCAKCETVFRLSAEALRTAGGQVRCGRCGEVFNALSRLAEDAAGFTQGESALFLETRAEEILESRSSASSSSASSAVELASPDPATPAERIELPPGMELARLEFTEPADEDFAAAASLEFTLPPGELDRIFVETRLSPLQRLAVPADRDEPGEVIPLVPVPAPEPPPPAPLTGVGLEVSEAVRSEMLAGFNAEDHRPGKAAPTWLPFAAWLGAALVLGVLLLVQLVLGNRDWMAVHVPLLISGPTRASLAVYQLRQWGVTGDPGAKGTLRVRASILNTAAQLQPYPLLRVTLVNRFGTRIGAREFEPAEYLGHGVARLLAPGERIDATLDILDPGRDAEGFEIDVCVRSAGRQMLCASDAPAPASRT